MAPKRPRDGEEVKSSKKYQKGFSVGPANLPDGIHRRKVIKIKRDLIHKAKLKKEYAKIKAREDPEKKQRNVYHAEDEEPQSKNDTTEPTAEPTLELHPDRQILLDKTSPEPEQLSEQTESHKRKKRPRPQPFSREAELAAQQKAEVEAKRRAWDESQKERAKKIAERERFRKAMVKARVGGKNGQRKLGRESAVLLERVKRLVGDGGG
ncbi:hypothetical protein K432DRAFT_300775 [Lepidopterella palustris CBS 459.81]|uniref:rRNA-processing protein FYV7 n=1 Tax=Lepidopterella palustris CBS 459.81 TaxID=1314670 RepID=A0A8E2E827_9PEZI|nr:hypothetical protein K432DRAFT_300775 [Lepidopterella palustris CBS 459.81]